MMLFALVLLVLTPTGDAPIAGFEGQAAVAQRKLEAAYDQHVDPKLHQEWMEFLTLRPHHVGSPKVKENAEWMVEKLRGWGLEAELEVFEVLIPQPKIRKLTLLEPTTFEAALVEPAIKGDPVADAIVKEGLPPYNAYSADGDVTAELVYVNQGLPRDYEELARRGIDVQGKIVIARYGGSWRGIKPKVAAEMGAVGCIIYNDPLDDGFYQGAGYPEGPYKHKDAVQRGSVLDLPLRPGDPLTPGYGAVPGAARIKREDADNIMKIPVLPISYNDALPLISALGGDVVPRSWRGAMPVTYRTGPGPAVVRLKLEFDWKLIPTYNVIAKLKGAVYPDQWVIRGNHHDAWVVGANDPISGTVALLAQARATAKLTASGWKPKRTLVFCWWDAEEPALLGSTDWVEHHRMELLAKTVAYINTDASSAGFLRVGGSHALETLVNQVARDTDDPMIDGSVADRMFARFMVSGSLAMKQQAAAHWVRLSPLGSGSDYSAFLQHVGVPTLNLGFGGHGRGGEYHTNFDTFAHYTKYKDPGLIYGGALTRVCGRLSLRLSEAPVLPFRFRDTVHAVETYAGEVMALADRKRREVQAHNKLVAGGFFEKVDNPAFERKMPKAKVEVPHFNFAPLQNAVARLKRTSSRLDALLPQAAAMEPMTLIKLNRMLYASESTLMGEGLPRRPWFRHQIYAPGFYTGYGVKTLPGIREGLEEGFYEEAQEQVGVTAAALNRLSDHLAKAIDLFED